MKFIDKTEWKYFHPLYLALGIGVAIPDIDMIIMAFFLSKGFSATDVGIGLALQSLFLLIAEIPTGVIADKYGKRISVQISWLMQSAIFALFFFIPNVWAMWVLFSLKGIAYTFSTGAFEALPYEIAKKAKRPELIDKYFSTYEFVYQFATALSNINVIIFLFWIGATTQYFIFDQPHQGMDFLWLTGSVGYFVGSLILFRIKDDVSKKQAKITNTTNKLYERITSSIRDSYHVAKDAVKYTKSHPVVSRLVVLGIFLEVVALLFSDLVYQPFLLNLNVKVEHIAILVALGSLVASLYSFVPQRVKMRFKSEKSYIEKMFILKLVVLLSLAVFTGPVYSMFFFLVYFGFNSLISPVMKPYKQYFYNKDMRATLGSVESFAINIVSVLLLPIIGYLVDNLQSRTTVLLSIFPLAIGYLIFKSIKHNERLQH